MANEAIIAKVKDIIAAPSCCAELREAAEKYLEAVGTEAQKPAAEALIAELKEDVCALEDVLHFFDSEAGAQVFGPEKAKAMADTAR